MGSSPCLLEIRWTVKLCADRRRGGRDSGPDVLVLHAEVQGAGAAHRVSGEIDATLIDIEFVTHDVGDVHHITLAQLAQVRHTASARRRPVGAVPPLHVVTHRRCHDVPGALRGVGDSGQPERRWSTQTMKPDDQRTLFLRVHPGRYEYGVLDILLCLRKVVGPPLDARRCRAAGPAAAAVALARRAALCAHPALAGHPPLRRDAGVALVGCHWGNDQRHRRDTEGDDGRTDRYADRIWERATFHRRRCHSRAWPHDRTRLSDLMIPSTSRAAGRLTGGTTRSRFTSRSARTFQRLLFGAGCV